MQMRLTLPLLLLLGFFIVACEAQEQSSKTSIAVVDMARVMRDSTPGKEGVKFLESRQTALQGQLDAIQDKLEKNPEDEKAMQELQRVYAVSQQRMQAEQQNVVNILFDTIQRTLNDYCTREGYDVILGSEAAAAFNQKIDITDAVIAEVDKQKVEFKPLPEARIPKNDENQTGDAIKNQDDAKASETGDKKQTVKENAVKPDGNK